VVAVQAAVLVMVLVLMLALLWRSNRVRAAVMQPSFPVVHPRVTFW
jgi:di/tricarboxylate transporter